MAIIRSLLLLLLSSVYFCWAYPSMPVVSEETAYHSLLENQEKNYEISDNHNKGPESRQAALIAALSAFAAPLAVSLISPLVSMLGTAILGRLQALEVSNAEPYNYDAYLINTPNTPSPYLFLTNPKTNDDSKKNTSPQTKRPSSAAPISTLLPTELGLPGLSYQTLNNNRQAAAIKKLIGRINIKSQLPKDGAAASNDEKISELRVIDSPSYDIYSDEVFDKRRSK